MVVQRCSSVRNNMIYPCRSVLQKTFSCIMKHPCIFGFFFGVGTVMVIWWNFSSFAHASRSFHIGEMRIFPFGSNVKDIYNGSLETLGKFLQQNELRFVAYYAPWCAQSRKMVPEMGLAADTLKETYDFIAINCWVGSCKMNFSLQEFPKFFAYHSTFPPIEFLETPESWRIVRFLQSIARPLNYVGNEDSLKGLMSSNEAIIFGYFNIEEENNKRFSVFLNLCLKNINKDSRILCGIITNNRIAELVGFQKYGQLILHQILGEKWTYPSTLNFTSDVIISWITKHHTEFAMKLSPNMWNLDHYISQLKRGPALLLFVSEKPNEYSRSAEVLHKFKYTAAVYNNCSREIAAEFTFKSNLVSVNENSRKLDLAEPCLTLKRPINEQLCDLCRHKRPECNRENRDLNIYLQNSNIYANFISTNSCNCLQNSGYSDCNFMTICCIKVPALEKTSQMLSNIFDNASEQGEFKKDELITGLKHLAAFDGANIAFKKALNSLIDAFEVLVDVASKTGGNLASKIDQMRHSTKKLLHQKVNKKVQKELKLLRQSFNANQRQVYINRAQMDRRLRNNFSSNDFTGLRCKTNKTVNFFYLDFEMHKNMVRDLGIERDVFKHSWVHPVLAIVDVKNEATFVMQERPLLTHDNLVSFITNFTNAQLDRHFRTTSQQIPDCSEIESSTKHYCINEVTTRTFENIVLDDSMDVFLMYYAPWCGFCKPAQRVFLEVARRFKDIKSLKFARINADLNELPYHYTVSGFPSFILFPMGRKADSSSYPDAEPIRVEEMTNFINKYSSRDTRTAIIRLLRRERT